MLTRIREQFATLKRDRRTDPADALDRIGQTTKLCLELLSRDCDRHSITWNGRGAKTYHVYSPAGIATTFSRPVRTELFVDDPVRFAREWAIFVEAAIGCRGSKELSKITSDRIDRLFYTAVIGFAAALEASGGTDRGGPGTFYEMLVGATLSLLLDLAEGSSISIPVPGRPGAVEIITTDISFLGAQTDDVILVVPTKISTRERISQAYVHQAILEKADPNHTYRSVLCVGSETNMFGPRPRVVTTASARDTLVPGTIALYQRYIATLSGLYYLDPPHDYVTSPPPGFPPTKRFSALLTGDLIALTADLSQ